MKRKLATIAVLMMVIALATVLLQPVITGLVVDNTSHTVKVRLFVVGNRAPVLDSISNQTATQGFVFTLQVTANDADGNNLTYSDNTSMFDIGTATGLINFTPSTSHIGNHSIKITVSDGSLSDSEAFSLEVLRGLYCGDGLCSDTESCSSCSVDCGSCPGGGAGSGTGGAGSGDAGTGAGAGAGAGGGGAGGGGGGAGFAGFCEEDWECTEWSSCAAGSQTRSCTDKGKCRTVLNKPQEQRSCVAPEEELPEAAEHCTDKVWNYNEEDVDCGGSCAPCIIKRFAEIPFPQIPLTEITKRFPWIIPIVMAILAGVMAAADRTYTFYVRKLHFERFRKREASYRPWRRRLYTGIASMFALALVYAVYIYNYSLNFASLLRNIWVVAVASVAVPAAVYVVIKKTEYSEFTHKVARQRLQRTHERQMWQLARLENETLLKIEEKAVDSLSRIASFEEFKQLLDMKELVKKLFDLHAKQTSSTMLPDEVKGMLSTIGQAPQLFHNYPELGRLGRDVEKLARIVEGDESAFIEAAGNLMDSMKEVARDTLLLSVITADKAAVSCYNKVVDLYQYFDRLEKGRAETSEAISGLEGSFVQLFEQNLTQDFVNLHKDSSDFVSSYNRLVELYDHYKKKVQSQ